MIRLSKKKLEELTRHTSLSMPELGSMLGTFLVSPPNEDSLDGFKLSTMIYLEICQMVYVPYMRFGVESMLIYFKLNMLLSGDI